MSHSRTPVDWLIVIVNVPAALLGLAIGWLWILDAANHYSAEDDHPNIRLGMSIGFIMSYLVWNTVVMTCLILRRHASTDRIRSEEASPMSPPAPIEKAVKVPTEAAQSNPPPVRKISSSSTTSAPLPEWVERFTEIQASGRDPATLPNPAPSSWLPDVGRTEESERRKDKN